MSEPADPADEYARFESLAEQVVNTPKPKPESAEDLRSPLGSLGEPADDDPEREHP